MERKGQSSSMANLKKTLRAAVFGPKVLKLPFKLSSHKGPVFVLVEGRLLFTTFYDGSLTAVQKRERERERERESYLRQYGNFPRCRRVNTWQNEREENEKRRHSLEREGPSTETGIRTRKIK
ncbi:unnamed protein product [Agarophyton chilense]